MNMGFGNKLGEQIYKGINHKLWKIQQTWPSKGLDLMELSMRRNNMQGNNFWFSNRQKKNLEKKQQF